MSTFQSSAPRQKWWTCSRLLTGPTAYRKHYTHTPTSTANPALLARSGLQLSARGLEAKLLRDPD